MLRAGGGVVVGTELTEPRGALLGLVALQELMDTAAAQPRSCGSLSDRQPSVMGSHDGPEAFLLRFG